MPYIVIPTPCFLDSCIFWKVVDGKKTWVSYEARQLYQWDSQHGEIEVYNSRGKHLGSKDALSGLTIKDAVKGRSINVR